jgi:DNA-binding response OmpR family regulator/DNA-binding CsgD family transcriptional regulator
MSEPTLPAAALAAQFPSTFTPVVLVVDDDIDILEILSTVLLEGGYVVLAATSATEALQRLEVAVPDGILLDAVMPGMDGFSLCQSIKANPAWAHVPVIFMTGLAETDHVLQGFAAGGVDYVVKPLRLPEVMARLATHVKNARTARMARDANDVSGWGTVVLDSRQRIAWRSPKSSEWLSSCFDTPESAAAWLAEAMTSGLSTHPAGPGMQLQARLIGEVGMSESMFLLGRVADKDQRLQNTALTPRETEVLSWISKGKTNRDIADILGMSPRTVNKHLEHIFEKLGVETRAAAAVIAEQNGL